MIRRRLLFLAILIAVPLSLGQAAAPESVPLAEESLNFEVKEPPQERNRDIEEQVTNLFYFARNHEKSGNLPGAVESYRKVLEIDPGNYRTMNNIAALLIRMNLWEESLGYLQSSIQLNDHYVPALINLGIVHARNGNSSEAERALLKAVSLEEQNRSALFNIAVLYENEGSYDRARGYYQRLQTLGESEGINGMKRLDNK